MTEDTAPARAPIDPAKLTPEQRQLWDEHGYGELPVVNAAGDRMTPEGRDAEFRYLCSLEGVGEP